MKKLIIPIILLFLIGCTHYERKSVKLYYVDGTEEIVSVMYEVHDNSTRIAYPSTLKEGCFYETYQHMGPIRCGVKKFVVLHSKR